MKLAQKIINEYEEEEKKKKLNTRVRDQVENYGSRSARIMVQEACKILKCMCDPDHSSPNPATQADMVKIKEAMHMGSEMAKHIKSVKERKRKMGEAKMNLDGFINGIVLSIENNWSSEDWEEDAFEYLNIEDEKLVAKLKDSFEVILTAARKKMRADMKREFQKILK